MLFALLSPGFHYLRVATISGCIWRLEFASVGLCIPVGEDAEILLSVKEEI